MKELPIIRPVLGEEEIVATGEVIASGWITQGPRTAAFESEFAAFTGAAHACAVSNCTVALHAALLAAGVKPGSEVVTVSHTFIATANAIRYCNAVPVFVDIEPATFNMDPDRVEAALSPRTSCILAVHQMGMPCDLARLKEIADRNHVPLVEDAACAIGSRVSVNGEWRPVGAPHGLAACFSFHPRKLLTTGDGGMITASSAECDRTFRLLRQHGMSVSDLARHKSGEVIFESYERVGYNYRLTDLQAAMGRAQLVKLPLIVERRRELAARYGQLLAGIEGLVVPTEPSWARSNWQSYCVRLPAGIEQKPVMQHLLNLGIHTRRGIMNAHLEPAYAGAEWRAAGSLEHSEAAQRECVILPMFHEMTEADMARVAEGLDAACRAQRGRQTA
ncbi:MAG TPA: DegT/DnrJ/EryC1/StrS family aminotransferase [Desulfovibrio sp.]|uniref:DegT/DnrJ/EryC1/StrS family aminotransferase n=1 Tax=Desulfovibrio sp. TaxID=885 RepID=UPI002C249969|nr:DegT/DnrJ/EryC1/StrS family aminotransferase [Desulfovibrio sp.]HMM38432.1 DegT/DnrJ/EryC1/StrS family aminotransferase [Desulfovibrio sp.]